MNITTDLTYKFLTFLLVFGLLGCQSKTPDLIHHERGGFVAGNLAENFVQAYNLHDVDGMLSWVHDEIRYMYISSDEIYTETKGKDALHQFLIPYFADKADAKSELVSSYQQGPYIQQVERALWYDASGLEQSQCSLSIYQIQNELIVNIWYFDVFQCPTK